MIKKILNLRNLLMFSFLLSVFLLALTKTYDYDAWIHLTMGKAIWELKGLPEKEPFLYTMADKPFEYSSWLFGVIYYLAYKLFDTYGIILLKASTITLAFYILLKDSLMEVRKNARAEVSLTQTLIAIMVLSIMVLISRYRFVERPDTFLMVFLPFSIYSLNAYVYHDKRYIYSLPLIHMLWANSHSSINLMIVPFGAFLIGGLLSRLIGNTTVSYKQLKTLLIVFIVSFVASTVSPYFINQFLSGIQFMATDWYKHEIMELQPPTWEEWKEPYILTISTILSFFIKWALRSKIQGIERDIIYLILIIPFIYLSFTAVRFIFILAIVSGPILVRNISSITEGFRLSIFLEEASPIIKHAISITIGLWIVLYTSLSIANIKPFKNLSTFGFGFSYEYVPEGAMKYLDKRNITGRIYNTFHWGQYITWRDFPKRSVFIDGRGYLSPELLEKRDIAYNSTSVMDELYNRYGFEVIVIDYRPFDELRERAGKDSSLSAEGWALVYWDDNSLVFLRRGGAYEDIIKEDEYKFIKPSNSIGYIVSLLEDGKNAEAIIKELKRNISETDSSKAYVFLGSVYNEIGLFRQAIEAFSRSANIRGNTDYRPTSYLGIGNAYLSIKDMDNAIKYYKKAISIKETENGYRGIALAYERKGKNEIAISYLKRANRLNPEKLEIYEDMIRNYKILGKKNEIEKLSNAYDEARREAQSRMHVQRALDLYNQKLIDKAIYEFNQSLKIKPNPSAYNNLGYIYYFAGDFQKAIEYQKRALSLDPKYADAHHALALIYKAMNQHDTAKRHLDEYIRLEKKGYFVRKAKKEIM